MLRTAATNTAAAVLLCLGFLGSVHAVTLEQFQEADKVFMAASAGDKAMIEEALNRFRQLSNANPDDPMLLVYLGSATSLMSNTTILPWKKTGYANEGMAIQDRAVKMAQAMQDKAWVNGDSTVLNVKFVAASTFLSVPRFFKRFDEGARLLEQVLRSVQFTAQSLSFRGAVWMRAARMASDQKRPGDARKYLEMVIKAGAPQAQAAKNQLAAL